MNVNDRIGLYWAISATGFGILFVIALVRFWRDWSRAKAAIAHFTGSWFLLCAVLAEMRLNAIDVNTPIATGRFSEAVRIMAALSVLGIIVEWVLAPTVSPWNGHERRSGRERREDWCRE